MGFLSKLFGKSEDTVTSESVKNEPNYEDLTGELFSSYLVNSYAASLRKGANDTKNKFTTIARLYQPLTFKQYCDNIKLDKDVSENRGFEPEIFLNQRAKIILNDESINPVVMRQYCEVVSTIYEGMLATSRSQQVKADMYGRTEDEFELTPKIILSFKRNLQNELQMDSEYRSHPQIFTRQGFERCGEQTLVNAREAVAALEEEIPFAMEFSFDAISAGTEDAQVVIAKTGKDFYTIKPQDEMPQIDQDLKEDMMPQEIDNVQ